MRPDLRVDLHGGRSGGAGARESGATNAASGDPSISQNGAFVAFSSIGTNLVAGQSDTNGVVDVFLYESDRGAPAADFDGDGDSDVSVFRALNSAWYVQGGSTSTWGTTADIPVPGDYDGDGDTDIAVFRPSNGIWFVNGGATTAWGASGDIPVPGDYDGDGDTDIAVFRPSNGIWFVNGGATTQFGTNGDVPLPLPDAVRRFFFPPL